MKNLEVDCIINIKIDNESIYQVLVGNVSETILYDLSNEEIISKIKNSLRLEKNQIILEI